MSMSKSERTELQRLVRQRFKLLREEVRGRQAEMAAEIDHAVVAKHQDRDEARAEVQRTVNRITEKANAEVDETIKAAGYNRTGSASGWYSSPIIRWGDDGRHEQRRALVSDLEAKVKQAHLRLDREEVDLLQALAIGALESDEAREFLGRIPTVAELVPASRMEELEASLADTPSNEVDPW